MKMTLFSKYSPAGASSRYRSYQYLPALAAAGVHCPVSPLFDDAYLSHKYAYGRASPASVLRALIRRLWAVLTLPRHSVVVIEYELLPYFPALLERWLAWRGCCMVVDYDDALFHQYDEHRSFWVRLLLGRKIATVMRLAHTVIAGNEYLANYARRAGATRVEIIPTVIDLERYPAASAATRAKEFTIGWVGSPSTAPYLKAIAPALAETCKDGRARVRLVGSGPIDLPGVPLDIIPWQEETEVDEIHRFDIGIMPLPDEPWARGKCGFKLIQYMACSLPVVASPVGVNTEIVDVGINGRLATSHGEWIKALQDLQQDKAARQRMGEAGRLKVEQRYCLQQAAPRLIKILSEASEVPSCVE